MNRNIFNSIQIKKPSKNTFDLTHDVKMTGGMGNLMPIVTLECLPGDKFTIGNESLIRFQPLLAPVMQRMDVYCHYFFVPNRILWDGWEKFIVNDPAAAALPFIEIDGTETAAEQRFLDYMGVPPYTGGATTAKEVNAIPFAAYQKIYDEYYRDQNLVTQEPTSYELLNGDNAAQKAVMLQLRKRAWEHDYFTSALPFAQKGAAVDIPLGNVTLDPNWFGPTVPIWEDGSGIPPAAGPLATLASGETFVNAPPSPPLAYNPDGSLIVDPTTINDLRRAFKLQEWLEKNARGGTRYVESNLIHFGVKSSDARLQRPEYITGSKSPVIISEVLQTSETGTTPQGTLAGHGVSVGQGYKGSYYCEEHGYIIGIMSVLPKPSYSQGIPKNYLKQDFLDFGWPEFANLGEQEVDRDEIFAYDPTPVTNIPFGYVPRYSEYKYMPGRIANEFRTTLDYWTLGRIFGSMPNLNQTFIEVDPATQNRIFAVPTADDYLIIMVLNKIKAVRSLPVFGTPMF